MTLDEEDTETFKKNIESLEKTIGDDVLNFWRCLNICHDVVQMNLKDSTGKFKMQLSGASQDEVTFLEMCRKQHYAEFVEKDSKNIKIKIKDDIEEYEVLRVLEFDSVRKRMSVIVKDIKSGKVINFVKGADMAIEPRLDEYS